MGAVPGPVHRVAVAGEVGRLRHLAGQVGVTGVHPGVQHADRDTAAGVPGRPGRRRPDQGHAHVGARPGHPVQPELAVSGAQVAGGQALPQGCGCGSGGAYRRAVDRGQIPGRTAQRGRHHRRVVGRDDQRQRVPSAGVVEQRGDVEQPRVEAAGGQQRRRVGRDHPQMSLGELRDQRDAVAARGRQAAGRAAVRRDPQPVAGDQGDHGGAFGGRHGRRGGRCGGCRCGPDSGRHHGEQGHGSTHQVIVA
jgi:hypothetical protein